jgi:hypothetical protein
VEALGERPARDSAAGRWTDGKAEDFLGTVRGVNGEWRGVHRGAWDSCAVSGDGPFITSETHEARVNETRSGSLIAE